MNIETSVVDSLMDQIFAMGPEVMGLLDSPENFLELLTTPVGLGALAGLVLLVVLVKIISKSRARKAQEEKRLAELEAALLDEDFEERALPVKKSAPLETWETEEDIARIMEAEPGWEEEQLNWDDDPDSDELLNPAVAIEQDEEEEDSLWQDQDPEFSNQIRITAESRRMAPPSNDTLPTPPEEPSTHAQEIEEEFQQLEAELKSRTLEVERKHRLNLDTESAPEDSPSPAERLSEPLTLSLDDLVEETVPEEPLFKNDDDLTDLFVDNPKEIPATKASEDDFEKDMEDTLASFSSSLENLGQSESDPLADMLLPDEPEETQVTAEVAQAEVPVEPVDPDKPYIDKLELFQKDLENRFQALTLESLTEKNSQLVHALNDSSDEEERVEVLHQQKRTVDLLSSMMFVGGPKRH